MKLVRLSRDMAPWHAGDDKLLADELADRLLASGEADNPRDRFGKPLVETSAMTPERRKGGYRTK